MSTTTSLPATLRQNLSDHSHRGTVAPRFDSSPQGEFDRETPLLRVDSGLPADADLICQDSVCQETAVAVLANSAVAELRFLRVDETEKTIHLSGRVRSFYHKQLAQEAMRPIAEGRLVVNRVEVRG